MLLGSQFDFRIAYRSVFINNSNNNNNINLHAYFVVPSNAADKAALAFYFIFFLVCFVCLSCCARANEKPGEAGADGKC